VWEGLRIRGFGRKRKMDISGHGGRVIGLMIAPQTTSTVSRRCSFSQLLPGPQALP
jgi:hypothetical protein